MADLYAYANIEVLDELAKKNNIDCPRLRGYRLMKDEDPIDLKEAIDEDEIALDCAEELCESIPFWSPNSNLLESSERTDYLKRIYIPDDEIRWDRIHGKKRKILKTLIHNSIVRKRKQYEMWNKYVGREDILYIHSRIGGGNWPMYAKFVINEPWFLEKVDDSFDSTYCDIYAKLTNY